MSKKKPVVRVSQDPEAMKRLMAVPIPDKQPQCKARVRTCKGCGRRFTKHDKGMDCATCHTSRRCHNKALVGTTVCRNHGGKAALKNMKEPRAFVARHLRDAYNRLIGTPDLLNLAHEFAMLVASGDDTQRQIDATFDNAEREMNVMQVKDALRQFESILAAAYQPRGKKEVVEFTNDRRTGWVQVDEFRYAVMTLKTALDPALVREYLDNRYRSLIQEMAKVSDIERRHLALNKQLIPVQHVYEVLVAFERVTLKYIRAQEDRMAYLNDLRLAIPIDVEALPAP